MMTMPATNQRNEENRMEIGNQIKALRIRKGVTQKQMAQHFGITEQAIIKWENKSSLN